jgi:hypothetical protein
MTITLRTMVGVCAVWALCVCDASAQQPAFAGPEDAVRALAAAVKESDVSSLVALLGDGSGSLAAVSDPIEARRHRDVFVAAMAERWRLADRDATHKELIVGNEAWPFPVPLVKGAAGWVFDAAAGREEVLERRIGRNELAAIRITRTYVNAQKLYATREHDGKPTGTYARRIASDAATENGLYWPPKAGKPRSPLGELLADAADAKTKKPFHGYYFRILEAQGSAAAGGAKNYLINGRMSGGFGLIAWPAQPELTGVMTFIVNQDGVVYEKSLGQGTPAAAITRFNPDKSWTLVK